jgi:hypothetical protein
MNDTTAAAGNLGLGDKIEHDLMQAHQCAPIAPQTATFPLTCTFCRHAPATHLIVLDNQWACGIAGSRRPHLVCADCAERNADDARKVAKSPASVWLFELHPVTAESVQGALTR